MNRGVGGAGGRAARAARRALKAALRPEAPVPASANEATQLRIAALEQQLAELRAADSHHGSWLTSIQNGVDDIRIAYGQQLSDLDRWARSAVSALNALTTTPLTPSTIVNGAVERRDPAEELRRATLVWTLTRYLEEVQPTSELLVSVIMPTHDRASHVRQAIASVLAQEHQHFELIVIDDASSDDTPAVLAAVDDPRLRVVRLEANVGGAAARNRGLDVASGDIVVYLDDDNLMARGWLRAVTWAFERWPECNLLYGARIIEDVQARGDGSAGALPSLEQYAYDRHRLERSNFIDMNTIAHRADLPDARFDETVVVCHEWPMMLRLTERETPLELPVIACVYRTDAPDRASDNPVRVAEANRIRASIPRMRPLRVLCHNAMYPMVTETYIGEEMRALEECGAVVEFSATQTSVSPVPLEKPLWIDIAEAVRTFRPDVIFAYWATHAWGELPAFETMGVPFAVRVHSFDMDAERVRALAAHPLCVGVWCYPQHVDLVPGSHGLVPLFGRHEEIGTPTRRTDVLSVSAGLPKKDWPTLLTAMGRLGDVRRHIIVGRTNAFEQLPDDVIAGATALADPPRVTVNASRDEVFEALRSTSVLLYTLEPGQTIGMPMSVVEALRAGACVVHPDDPQMRHVLGASWRPYRNADDIVRQVREVLRGGPAIEQERVRNEAWARATFCDPELGKHFHEELLSAVCAWLLGAGAA
ncbi:MAG TPA: glycosyltransferase [Mycobacteriales bacterium]|nr:glycosyltransferase [Mycobacteriales bacterium]